MKQKTKIMSGYKKFTKSTSKNGIFGIYAIFDQLQLIYSRHSQGFMWAVVRMVKNGQILSIWAAEK
jgi:hypothetical protein